MSTAQATQTHTVGLVLEPLDVLFFRDGRPFGTADQATSRPMPLPQTVAGAVMTALLRQDECDFERLKADICTGSPFDQALANQNLEKWAQVQVRGPWLAVQHREKLDLLFVPPAHWRYKAESSSAKGSTGAEGPLVALRPLPRGREKLPGWESTYSGQKELRPLWFFGAEELEKLPLGWVPWELMAKMLGQQEITLQDVCDSYAQCGLLQSAEQAADWEQLARKLPRLVARDRRTGIGIDPRTFSVTQGLIYSAEFLSLLWQPQENLHCVLYVEVQLPQPQWPEEIKTLHLGGEGRQVRVVPRQPQPWNELCQGPGPGQKPLLVLTTPALCQEGWLPGVLKGLVEAAVVPGYESVSGWDLARGGPKPSRFAVPAGSVYFLKQLPASQPDVLSDKAEDQQQGWGHYLTGVWKDG